MELSSLDLCFKWRGLEGRNRFRQPADPKRWDFHRITFGANFSGEQGSTVNHLPSLRTVGRVVYRIRRNPLDADDLVREISCGYEGVGIISHGTQIAGLPLTLRELSPAEPEALNLGHHNTLGARFSRCQGALAKVGTTRCATAEIGSRAAGESVCP
jgi:hypothetical protein